MLELENHYVAIPSELIYSSNNNQWMKSLDEKFGGNSKIEELY